MTVPGWVKDAIFYQIFPDRFCNGKTDNDPFNVEPWSKPPSIHGFQGGDIDGIIQKLDYLADLGINAIYLNPIFTSPSTHRYNTTDYYQIDPKLGALADFRHLIQDAHRRNIRIVLDGVFNHCGRGFFAFADILENQSHSAYRDWFHIKHFPVDAYGPGDAVDYVGWWKYKSLPKFNTSTKAVRQYIFDVARYWVDFGIDGWRLDVPNEIDDDAFWAEFRRVVRSANPDTYLLGEIWDGNPRWIGEDHFDGLMDYPFREATLNLVNGRWTCSQFQSQVEAQQAAYPKETLSSMYTLLGSHDVERPLTLCEGHIDRLKIAVLLQMVHTGAPAVYYGDEVGLTGGKDPACRGTFPWDERGWNWELRSWTQQLIRIRKKHPALRTTQYSILLANDDKLLVFTRGSGTEQMMIVVNPTSQPVETLVPIAAMENNSRPSFYDELTHQEIAVNDGQLLVRLPAYSGTILA